MGVSGLRKHRRRDESLRFGIFWPYSQTPIPSAELARRNPNVLELENHLRLAQAVEAVELDFALIADGYAPPSEANSKIGFQDPSTNAIILAVPLMLATSHLGFLSTIHTRYVHPVVIARLGAHLDWVSGGRWGWNIVNGFRDREARLFGLDSLDHDGGYDLSDEAVEIVKALWSNPTQDLEHQGPAYTVRGRLRRPLPETQPLLVSAASSERGRAFASKHCDYLFAGPNTAGDVTQLARDLEQHALVSGKNEAPKILVLAEVFVRDEPGRARAEHQALIGSIDAEAQADRSAELAKVVHVGRRPDEIMRLIGTTEEVAQQIIALRRESPTGGLIFRLALWTPEEALRLQGVFAILERAGIWQPPQGRGFSW